MRIDPSSAHPEATRRRDDPRSPAWMGRPHDLRPRRGEPWWTARLEARDRPTRPAFSILRPGGSRTRRENSTWSFPLSLETSTGDARILL